MVSCHLSVRASLPQRGINTRRPARPGRFSDKEHLLSTQTSFDLSGLIEAIESSNAAYQVALYAEHAEVQITDGDSLGQAPRVLIGKPAIARWVEDLATRHIIHHVVDPVADRRSVSYVDELHQRDGTTILHRCTAEISTGQISQQYVTVEAIAGSTESTFRRRPTPAGVMTDEDPGLRPRSWTAPTRSTDRHLAGNFVG